MSTKSFQSPLKAEGARHEVHGRLAGDRLEAVVDGEAVVATVRHPGPGEIVLFREGCRTRAIVVKRGDRWLVAIGGRTVEIARADALDELGAAGAAAEPFAVSPMAGLLTKVHVVVGASVGKGAPLFAVEAMKMEYVVKADRDVVIAEVKHAAGARIDLGAPVVVFQ